MLKYYSIHDKILPMNADINLIFGQRSQGKTYSCLKYALEQFAENNTTFTYIRRWSDDIKGKDMDKLCSSLPIEDIFGIGYYISYWRGAFTLCRDEVKRNGEMRKVKIATIGWAIALNAVHHTKSQNFPNCKTVIFDEFVQLRNERIIDKETDAWEQTLSTILRTTTDAKIFLLGNTVSQRSPYFMLYGIDIRKLKQGEVKLIKINNGKQITKIAVEWCEYAADIGEKTSKYVINSKMAKTGEWEIPDVSDIPHTEGEVSDEKLLCTILDTDMELSLGIFVRYSTYYEMVNINGIYSGKAKHRSFLVIRETKRESKYFHLTTLKGLTYNCYMSWNKFITDIKDYTGIDIINELEHGRVYASGPFTADYFCGCVKSYNNLRLSDKL